MCVRELVLHTGIELGARLGLRCTVPRRDHRVVERQDLLVFADCGSPLLVAREGLGDPLQRDDLRERLFRLELRDRLGRLTGRRTYVLRCLERRPGSTVVLRR